MRALCFLPTLSAIEFVFRLGFPWYLSIFPFILLISPELVAGISVVLWASEPLEEGKLIRKPRTWIVLLGFISIFACCLSFLVFIFETLTPNLSFFYRGFLLPYFVIMLVILVLFRTKLKQKILPFINRLFDIEE